MTAGTGARNLAAIRQLHRLPTTIGALKRQRHYRHPILFTAIFNQRRRHPDKGSAITELVENLFIDV